MPVRSTSAFSVSAARSTGCQSFRRPLRLPSGVRMASTMTAVGMAIDLLGWGLTGSGQDSAQVWPERPRSLQPSRRSARALAESMAGCRTLCHAPVPRHRGGSRRRARPSTRPVRTRSRQWTFTASFADDVATRGRRPGASAASARDRRVLLMMRNRPEFHWSTPPPSSSAPRRSPSTTRRRPRRSPTRRRHAGAELAIVEDAGFVERFLKVARALPALEHRRDRPAGDACDRGARGADLLASVPTWTSWPPATLARRPRHPDLHVGHHRAAQGRDDHPAQRRVHRRAARRCIGSSRPAPAKRVISYLPMAHIAERIVSPLPRTSCSGSR